MNANKIKTNNSRLFIPGIFFVVVILFGVWKLAVMQPEQSISVQNPDTHVRTILETPGFYNSISWITDEWLAVEVQQGTDMTSGRIFLMKNDGSNMTMLNLPGQSGCKEVGYSVPSRLPDGRLGYVVTCHIVDFTQYVMAYDLNSKHFESILSFPIPSLGTGSLSQGFDPTVTRGMAVMGAGIGDKLYQFTRDKWKIVDVGFAEAFGPAWSPDGQRIAFMAASEETSPYRSAPPVHLYVMDPDATKITPLVENPVYDTIGAVWSPDNRWLAFAGAVQVNLFSTYTGLWLVNSSTGALVLVASGYFSKPSWSPNGQRIVAIQKLSREYDTVNRKIVVIDVSSYLTS